MVLATGLKDLGYKGNSFTLENNRKGQAYVAAMLDRAFTNTHWLDNLFNPFVTHPPRLCSNHNPILPSHRIQLSAKSIPFKFEAMWLSHDSFLKVVETSWTNCSCCRGNAQFVLAQKLKFLKKNLKVWNKEVLG